MDTLVLYESQYGNTKKIAEIIAEQFKAEGVVRVAPIGGFEPSYLGDVDLLIVGGPTQGHTMTVAMKKMLARLDPAPRSIVAAAFDTRVKGPMLLWGSAAHEIAAKLQAGGYRVVTQPESFLVTLSKSPVLHPGEEDRARAWGAALVGVVKAARKPVTA